MPKYHKLITVKLTPREWEKLNQLAQRFDVQGPSYREKPNKSNLIRALLASLDDPRIAAAFEELAPRREVY